MIYNFRRPPEEMAARSLAYQLLKRMIVNDDRTGPVKPVSKALKWQANQVRLGKLEQWKEYFATDGQLKKIFKRQHTAAAKSLGRIINTIAKEIKCNVKIINA